MGILKNNTIKKSVMFISSYFPLYIFLLILQFDKIEFFINEKQINIEKYNDTIFLLLIISFIIVSFFSLYLLKEGDYYNTLNLSYVKRASDAIISYVFTYILPIITFPSTNYKMKIVNLMLFILIWILYIRLNLIYLNPLWALFGYISYEANGCYIISNMTFEELKSKEGSILSGYYLTNNIFVAKKKNN